MKKVCLFNFPEMIDFHGYRIETFDSLAYSERLALVLVRPHRLGLNGYDERRALTAGAAGVDRLYRERNPRLYRRSVVPRCH